MVGWLARYSDELVLSAIVLAELQFYVANQPDGAKKRVATQVLASIDTGVGSRFANFDGRDAQAYGDLMARMRRNGTPLPAIDGLIAAHAIARRYAVATRNTKDFLRTGVELIDPWQA